MTIRTLIELLHAHPNPDATVWVWDPVEEVSGEIRLVKDIHEPTDNQDVFIIADFG